MKDHLVGDLNQRSKSLSIQPQPVPSTRVPGIKKQIGAAFRRRPGCERAGPAGTE